MKKMNILVLFDSAGTPPADQDFSEEFKQQDWFTEAAVVETLQAMGHEVRTLGIYDDIGLLINEVAEHRPDIVFNLTEVFMGEARNDRNIPALLELLQLPYTGCGPDGLHLCNNKALTKKILMYHRVKVPRFHVFRQGKTARIPAKLAFPLVVKPLREEASTGISQASYVTNEETLGQRIRFIHEKMDMNAIAEEYIDGRELYVSVLGQDRLTAFPIREMTFANVSRDEPTLATYKAKWDPAYRARWGIANDFAADLPPETARRILHTCKRAYRALVLDGYARFDCRLTNEGVLYIIEANANPELALGDEFAESAAKGGYNYERLLRTIVQLGFARK